MSGTNAMWDDPYSNSKAVAVFDRADTFVGLRGKRGEVIDLATAQEIAAPGGSELVGFQQDGTGAVTKTVGAKLRESVSVKDFGAVGDGVTDDTTTIQEALNCGAKVVFFPPGVYRITDTLTLNAEIIGVSSVFGNDSSVIEMDSEAAKVILVGASGQTLDLSYIKNITNMVVRGKAGQTRLHTGIYGSMYQHAITNCFFDNLAVGFDVDGVYARWETCWINDCGVGIWPRGIKATLAGAAPSTTFQLERVVFTYCGYGFKQESRHGQAIPKDNLIQILFLACGFELCEYGLYADHRAWLTTIENSWFEGNSQYGLYAPAMDVVEINNRHEANSPRLVADVDSADYGVTVVTPGYVEAKYTKTKFLQKAKAGQLININAAPVNIPVPENFEGWALANTAYVGTTRKAGFILQGDHGDNTARTAWTGYVIRDGGASTAPSSWVFSQLAQGAATSETPRLKLAGSGAVLPGADNAQTLGSNTARWQNVYSANIVLTPAASVTPANNGEVTLQLTSNTQLTIKAKGSDGVVRSVNLTLA